MDCVRALQIVSDAMDGIEVDTPMLTEAKEHCRECTECRSFVRAMLAVQNYGIPKPPADLPDRIMTTIRAEAKSTAIARARALAAPGARQERAAEAPLGASKQEAEAPSPVSGIRERLSDPRNRRTIATWASVAAMVFILAGWGAVAGMRTILTPSQPLEYDFVGTEGGGEVAQVQPEAKTETYGSALSAAPDGLAADAAGPGFVTVEGSVYRLTGIATEIDRQSLTPSTTTRTRLDGQGRSKERDILASPSGLLYLEADDDVLQTVERVTFTYKGIIYQLKSRAIDSLGEWPSLPDTLRQPDSADGNPTFELDSEQQAVYRLRGGTAVQGIALAPNPTAIGDLAGCPNWTWWEPAE